jgi:hypothetical protein
MASRAFFLAPGRGVADARDGSWSYRYFAWLYLTTKPAHLGVDMDGLACPLYGPTTCGC